MDKLIEPPDCMTSSSRLTAEEIQARREALLAAERSGMMEGLPPVSDVGREQGELWATGKITADEAVAAITRYYLNHPDRLLIDSK